MRKTVQHPMITRFSSRWQRFSEYNIREIKDENGEGYYYIVPADNALVVEYDPFDFFPEIFLDTIRLGDAIFKLISRYEITDSIDNKALIVIGDRNIIRQIQKFTKSYGVLGTNRQSHTRFERNRIMSIANNESLDSIFDYSQYDKKIPPSWNPHCENLEFFIDYILDIYRVMKLCNSYENGYFSVNDPYNKIPEDIKLRSLESDTFTDKRTNKSLSWEERFESLLSIPLYAGLGVNDNNELKLVYKFDRLYDAISLMLLQHISMFRFCPECGSFFELKCSTHDYCSPSCRSNASVKRVRDKIKKAKELKNQGANYNDIARECDTSVEQIRKWLKESE